GLERKVLAPAFRVPQVIVDRDFFPGTDDQRIRGDYLERTFSVDARRSLMPKTRNERGKHGAILYPHLPPQRTDRSSRSANSQRVRYERDGQAADCDEDGP